MAENIYTPNRLGTGLTIGSNTGDLPIQGSVDEVMLLNRALSAAEIQSAMNGGYPFYGDGKGDVCDACPNNPDPTCQSSTCTDNDGDGYGIVGASNCGAGHADQIDCDDSNPTIHPNATDSPDGMDNDCNGNVDGTTLPETRYAWDGNGNMVKKGDTTYTWDARDRLVGGDYGYDASNLRVKMGEQKVLLDGIEEAREYGPEAKRYDHDPMRVDGLLAQKSGAGKGYFVTDALGSVYGVVDGSGATVSKYAYDVYGARTAGTEGMATSWGFTGRRHELGPDALYSRMRYQLASGLWVSTDPLRSVQGLHSLGVGREYPAYRLVGSNPTRFTDPLGLFTYDADILSWGISGPRAIDYGLQLMFVDIFSPKGCTVGHLTGNKNHAPGSLMGSVFVAFFTVTVGVPKIALQANATWFQSSFETHGPAQSQGLDFLGVGRLASASIGLVGGMAIQYLRLGDAVSDWGFSGQYGLDTTLFSVGVGTSIPYSWSF